MRTSSTERSTSWTTVACVGGLLLLAGCGMMPSLSIGLMPRTSVPAEIAAGPDERLALIGIASGVQVYRCDVKAGAGTPTTYEGALQAPEATMRDPGGRYLGKHYLGPTWEAEDGSKVVGTVDARRDASNGSIPWLRLKARSIGGAGTFNGVTTVLRVATTGGVPLAASCNELERGRITRIEYAADYYFYVKR